MAWSETQAARAIPALADAGCELVEQPVASAAALARLMRRFPVALMADEILQGPDSAFEIAKQNGAHHCSIANAVCRYPIAATMRPAPATTTTTAPSCHSKRLRNEVSSCTSRHARWPRRSIR